MSVPNDAISEACITLVRQFCLVADAVDADAFALLFTEDGVFERGKLRVEGREGLAKMAAARPAGMITRHLLTTSFVQPVDADTATGTHYCLVYVGGGEHDPTKPIVREYRDSYRRTAQGWRIAHRSVLTPFEG